MGKRNLRGNCGSRALTDKYKNGDYCVQRFIRAGRHTPRGFHKPLI